MLDAAGGQADKSNLYTAIPAPQTNTQIHKYTNTDKSKLYAGHSGSQQERATGTLSYFNDCFHPLADLLNGRVCLEVLILHPNPNHTKLLSKLIVPLQKSAAVK